MIGILVSGHGTFASGITSGLKLLAGEPEFYKAVDFMPEDSTDILKEHLEEALEGLKECSAVLILTDLVGGSPFNVSLGLKLSRPESIEVVGGTNLPVLLDAYMSRNMAADAALLAESSVKAGIGQLVWYQPSNTAEDEYEE